MTRAPTPAFPCAVALPGNGRAIAKVVNGTSVGTNTGQTGIEADIMNSHLVTLVRSGHAFVQRSACAGLAALWLAGLGATAFAAEKPPLAPDTVAPFNTDSRISATIEFGLPALAADIEQDIPRRLATIDERISCVHRRVLFFKVNANCDVWGYVERSGPVSLYGRGDRVYGSVPIYGAIEGQGANRFTSRIHGETEASATVEAEARPQLNRDWSLDLNFNDGFRWSEPPVLHVMGRDIPIANYAEPRIREQLAHVRSRALATAQRLDLKGKAARAWQHAFEPIELSNNPQVSLQLTPRGVAFAGVRADGKVLRGSLELSGSAATYIGQSPPIVAPTALPSLGGNVSETGAFDVVVPIGIGYDSLKDRLTQAIAAIAPAGALSVRDIDVYPSSGKLVIGLRIARTSETTPDAGRWVYLSGAAQVDEGGRTVRLADLAATTDDEDVAAVVDPIVEQLHDRMSVDYGIAYENLLNAANAKLTRPLKDGFRMEGSLNSAKLEHIYLSADGIVLALRASGELRIVYRM
jgi:hypothetical protein